MVFEKMSLFVAQRELVTLFGRGNTGVFIKALTVS